MIKPLPLLFTILITICSAYISQAQLIINGIVNDSEGTAADGAIVSLYESDTLTTVEYTMTDEKGSYSIETNENMEMILEVSMFGYKSEYLKIPAGSTGMRTEDFTLTESSFNINEVTIEGEEIGVSQNGDTMTFHIQNFTTGAERNLGDVLQRLPGLEIRDGSVYYGNTKIKKMLVQGKDIINSNQKLATEGIRADQIQNIKVIQNYKESEDKLEEAESEDVAVDVRLKESEQNKWSGNADVLGGAPSSYMADINAFNLGSDVGLSGFARLNNVGEQSISFRDMMSMMEGDGNMFTRRYTMTGNLIPSEIYIRDDVNRNIDGSVTMNLDYRFNKKVQVRGFVMGAYAERESREEVQTEFINQKSQLNQTTNQITKVPIANTMWRFTIDPDTNSVLSLTLPFTYNTSSNLTDRFGDLNGEDFDTDKDEDAEKISFSPSGSYKRRISKVTNWDTRVRFNYTQDDGVTLFEDPNAFLGIPFADEKQLYAITQDRTFTNTNMNVSTSLKSKWDNNFMLRPSIEYSRLSSSLEFDANEGGIEDFDTDDGLDEEAASASLEFGLESDSWEIKPSAGINYLNRDFDIAGETTDYYPDLGMGITRIWNRAHRLSLRTNYGIDFISFNQAKQTYEISSTNNLVTGGFDITTAIKSFSSNLNYNLYKPLTRTFVYAGMSYNKTIDAVQGFSNQVTTPGINQYLINGYLLVPGNQNFSMYGGFGTRIKNIIAIRPSINLSYNDGFSVLNNGASTIESTQFTQRYGIDIDSDWDFPLNVELEFNYEQRSQKADRDILSRSYSPELELEYTVGQFRIETEFTYDYTDVEGRANQSLNIWDAEAEYALKNIPLKFIVEASNILNFTDTNQLETTFNSEISQIRRYTIFPGYVVAGVSFEF